MPVTPLSVSREKLRSKSKFITAPPPSAKIDALEIRWPSGKVETLKNLDADKVYAVLEGQGIVPSEKIRPAVPNHAGHR
jgi:hypothetical protein